ncbi:MAG: toxins and related Ca2+-binding protein, partial [Cellvibrio sp.]|nr:toxins and related Ca2+-binding protein [Cellvibrio sp.]
MVAIVSGSGLGLLNVQLAKTDVGGTDKNPIAAHVNTTTGNLILRQQDEILINGTSGYQILRTYNSLGQMDGDNNDGHRFSFSQSLGNYIPLSAITRTAADGSSTVFNFSHSSNGIDYYKSADGEGAHDTLAYDGSVWVYAKDGGVANETYELSGTGWRLKSVVNAAGHMTRLGYDGVNRINLIEVYTKADHTEPEQAVRIEYNGSGQIQALVNRTFDGTIWTETVGTRYQYDASGRLESVITDLTPADNNIADGKVYRVTYTYDGASTRISSITQGNGQVTQLTYEQDSTTLKWKVKTIAEGTNPPTTFFYGTNNTHVFDSLGQEWIYHFDAKGQLIEQQSPALNGQRLSTRYEYDVKGNTVATVDGENNRIIYEYDEAGNQVGQRDDLGNTVKRTYNTANQVVAETLYQTPDPDGSGAEVAQKPLTTRYIYTSSGLLRFEISASGRVTEHQYNLNGERASTIKYGAAVYSLTGLTPADTLSESTLGAWVLLQDLSKNQRTDFEYDIRGQLNKTIQHSQVNTSGAGVINSATKITTQVYDPFGRLIQQVNTRGSQSDTSTYSYDGLGRRLTQLLPDGALSTSYYNDAAQRVEITDAQGTTTLSTYDTAGCLTSVAQQAPVGSPLANRDTLYFYDTAGQRRAEQAPDGSRTYVFYDAAGRTTATVDATGAVTEYIYDRRGLKTKTIQYANRVNTQSWLVAGQVVPSDISLIRPVADAQRDRSTQNLYDAAGRLLYAMDAENNITFYQYDGAGRLTGTEKFTGDDESFALLDVKVENVQRKPRGAQGNLFGTAGNDNLLGSDIAQSLYGYAGADTLDGGLGNDYLYGGDQTDSLIGNEDDDFLYGGNHDDFLFGSSGNDNLNGDAGNDQLWGGTGNDSLDGGLGNDTYHFNYGDGQDTISSNDSTVGRNDVIRLNDAIPVSDVRVTRSGSALYITLISTGDRVTIPSHFSSATWALNRITFGDGTSWDEAAIQNIVSTGTAESESLYGDTRNDTIMGLVGKDWISGAAGNDTLDGGINDDTLYGEAGSDLLLGGVGTDTLSGGTESDTLYGGGWDDILNGEAGDDHLFGGMGSDSLDGGAGSDIYYFGYGDGRDTISNNDSTAGRNDVVRLDNAVSVSDVRLTRSGNELHITLLSTGDRIIVNNHFTSSQWSINQIVFGDATIWDAAAIQNKVATGTERSEYLQGDGRDENITGLAGFDSLYGGLGNDTLDGGIDEDLVAGEAGNDVVYGGVGNDSLYGGTENDWLYGELGDDKLNGDAGSDNLKGGQGNDALDGGAGNDIYHFTYGDGSDTISNSDGVAGRNDILRIAAPMSDVRLTRVSNDLVATLISTGDRVQVYNHFSSTTWQINGIEFNDSNTLNVSQITAAIVTAPATSTITGTTANDILAGTVNNDVINAGNGNDTLSGGVGDDSLSGVAGDDYLFGGKGADYLDGGAGNDTYYFGYGDGRDTIYNHDNVVGRTDILQLDNAITVSDVRLTRSADHLYITLISTGDRLQIQNHFLSSAYSINSISFGNGTVWGIAEIQGQVSTGTNESESLYGDTGNNSLTGLIGRDQIYGVSGNDTLDGGVDNDTLWGDIG